MSFHPPVRPEVKPKPPKKWYEELLEKDEILLYFTAILGVLLPAVVYVVYHKIHSIYMNYVKKRDSERLADEAARSEVAVISLCTEDSPAQRFLTHLQSTLSAELINPPKLWPVENLKTKDFIHFKGFCVFVVETLTAGAAPISAEWFLDWLEDVAADAKQKRKANFDALKFVIVGFGSSTAEESHFNKVSHTLLKRMKILGSKQIMNVVLFDTSQPGRLFLPL
ncbi:unnamed protein product [Angiostrongylus costaricensis]|uniref:Flavodoxin-like domain-containing protein n=1 Tax=Angiostrongylus costaricensis TaxID=334426 RepID=A0A0R3PW03_ANGCS|nr:unnamed protein product [Angiostrongylus costaricensis]